MRGDTMSDSPYDLRDYFFGELTLEQRREVERYLETSEEARDELQQLRATQITLLSVPNEEVPQRIRLASEKVLSPSPGVRPWRDFWGVAPRLAFGLATILVVMFAGLKWVQPSLTVDSGKWTLVFGDNMHSPTSPAIAAAIADQLALQVQQALEESEIRQQQIITRLATQQGIRSASGGQMAVTELGEDFYQAWRMRRNRLRLITRSAHFDQAVSW